MAELFLTGRIVDLILGVMVIEAIIIGRRADIVAMLLPGACLLLALRAALVGADWTLIALLLAGSFLAHIVYVLRRLRDGNLSQHSD